MTNLPALASLFVVVHPRPCQPRPRQNQSRLILFSPDVEQTSLVPELRTFAHWVSKSASASFALMRSLMQQDSALRCSPNTETIKAKGQAHLSKACACASVYPMSHSLGLPEPIATDWRFLASNHIFLEQMTISSVRVYGLYTLRMHWAHSGLLACKRKIVTMVLPVKPECRRPAGEDKVVLRRSTNKHKMTDMS